MPRIINCSGKPYIPEDWELVTHNTNITNVDVEKISPYLSSQQKSGYILGEELLAELANQPVLNANVLDYLVANPELIPEYWRGIWMYFLGTIYHSNGDRLVRCLYWDNEYWCRDHDCLGTRFYSDSPAAVLAA